MDPNERQERLELCNKLMEKVQLDYYVSFILFIHFFFFYGKSWWLAYFRSFIVIQ